MKFYVELFKRTQRRLMLNVNITKNILRYNGIFFFPKPSDLLCYTLIVTSIMMSLFMNRTDINH